MVFRSYGVSIRTSTFCPRSIDARPPIFQDVKDVVSVWIPDFVTCASTLMAPLNTTAALKKLKAKMSMMIALKIF